MIPMTLNHRWPSQTWTVPSARSTPSAAAASAPRTTAGYRAVAASEEGALGHPPLQGAQQAGTGRVHGDGVGVRRGDAVVPVHAGVHVADGRRAGDRADPGHHGGRLRRQRGRLPARATGPGSR